MYENNNYLAHHGVKGMKWGVRRAKDPVLVEKKAAYKQAKKEYDESYSKAYKYSSRHPVGQWASKKKSAEADRRWKDAIDKAGKLNTAKSEYKQAKKDAKNIVKTANKTTNTSNNKKDATDVYFEKTAKNTKSRRAGYAMTVAGTVLKYMGQQQYNTYKNNSSPGRTAVINGLGYSGKALQTLGPMVITASNIQQYRDYREWRNS